MASQVRHRRSLSSVDARGPLEGGVRGKGIGDFVEVVRGGGGGWCVKGCVGAN